MNIKEFIESGVLELYALNELSSSDRMEVETMAQNFPEVAQELKEIEKTFENLAISGAIKPKDGLKDRIAQNLQFSNSKIEEISIPPISQNQDFKSEKKETEVVSIRFYWMSLAACLTLLAISIISLIRLSISLEKVQNQYLAAIQDTKRYASQTRYIEEEYRKNLEAQSDTNMISLKLKGTSSYPNALALVYWNKKLHKVSINPNTLPPNDAQHSYQLWAIVNGKPVNEGTFEVQNGLASLNTMKDRDTAQAFAVTLEPRGGSPSPHLDQLVVIASI